MWNCTGQIHVDPLQASVCRNGSLTSLDNETRPHFWQQKVWVAHFMFPGKGSRSLICEGLMCVRSRWLNVCLSLSLSGTQMNLELLCMPTSKPEKLNISAYTGAQWFSLPKGYPCTPYFTNIWYRKGRPTQGAKLLVQRPFSWWGIQTCIVLGLKPSSFSSLLKLSLFILLNWLNELQFILIFPPELANYNTEGWNKGACAFQGPLSIYLCTFCFWTLSTKSAKSNC